MWHTERACHPPSLLSPGKQCNTYKCNLTLQMKFMRYIMGGPRTVVTLGRTSTALTLCDLPLSNLILQMKFMRYIMGGPRTYFGNLRGVHVTMVTEGGLDLPRFNLVVGLLGETMKEMRVPQVRTPAIIV